MQPSESSTSSSGSNIKVYVRIRPAGEADGSQCLQPDEARNALTITGKPGPKKFTFDHVSTVDTPQEDVFNSVGRSLIDSCISGYNGTIFAYGQTGSGKTYTMLGPHEDMDICNNENRGVIPRTLEYLFSIIKNEQEKHNDLKQFTCRCSFLEIYNEQIFDLLDGNSRNLSLREDGKKGVFVLGVTEKLVSSANDAYNVLDSGWINRRVASTSMNRESSRSHAVFTLKIESKENKGSIQNIKSSYLNLVDLAGSEKQKSTNSKGATLKEAGCINNSLSVLGNVIMALVDIAKGKNKNSFVPYRNSKLTFLLKDSLGGNAKACIITCVHPGSKCYAETLSSLQFAQRAKMIKNKAVMNEDVEGNVAHLQAELRRLKDMLQQGSFNTHVTNGKGDSLDSCGGSNFRDCFSDAMFFIEIADKEREACQDRLHRLEEVLKKKDGALLSTKMVLKFKERTIGMLEKKIKSGSSELQPDDKDALIDVLKKEAECLQRQVTHHPELARLQMENETLRCRIDLLTSEPPHTTSQHRLLQLQHHLSNLKQQHHTQAATDTDDVDLTAQKSQEILLNPSMDDLDQMKALVEKYKSEAQKAQTDETEFRHQTEKELVSLRAKLTSLEQINTTLEDRLLTSQSHWNMERNTLNNMHLQTIKVMSSPMLKRRGSRLSSGSGSESNSLVTSNWLDLDLSGEHQLPGIQEEEEPVEMLREMQATLTNEIQVLQTQNTEIRKQLQEDQESLAKLQGENAQLSHRIQELDQILERERYMWTAERSEKDDIMESQATQITHLSTEVAQLRGKCHDLDVVLKSADKESRVTKMEMKRLNDTRQREIADFNRVIAQLELYSKVMEKERDTLKRERDELQTFKNCNSGDDSNYESPMKRRKVLQDENCDPQTPGISMISKSGGTSAASDTNVTGYACVTSRQTSHFDDQTFLNADDPQNGDTDVNCCHRDDRTFLFADDTQADESSQMAEDG